MSDTKEAKTPRRNVGTTVTEKVIGTALSKFNSAVKNFNEIGAMVDKLEQSFQDQSIKAEEMEQKLSELSEKYKTQLATNKIELELAAKADLKGIVDSYLKDNELTTINAVELTVLKSKLQDFEQNFDSKVDDAANTKIAAKISEISSQIKVNDAQHKADIAASNSLIESLKEQCENLKDQAALWQKEAHESRLTTIEIAKAGKVGEINVGTSNLKG